MHAVDHTQAVMDQMRQFFRATKIRPLKDFFP